MNAQTSLTRDLTEDLRRRVLDAAETRTPLAIRGSGSKAFYGRDSGGEPLDVSGHRGIVSYEPTELYLTARAGTPLAEIDAALTDSGQMLGCEPPAFGPGATVGGTVAAGLSGPRRPYAGSVRDYVLGVKVLNGRGEVLRFGGQVMKNVAGYDVSRLMTGALGSLGVLLEVSFKVLPRPVAECTLVQEATQTEAIERLNRWAGQPLPLSASAWDDGRLSVRLSGAAAAVEAAARALGGERLDPVAAEAAWAALREQTHAFFAGDEPLWRLSVAPASAVLALPGAQLIEWGGAQRWWRGDGEAAGLRARAAAAGGHATRFRGGERSGEVFQPLAPGLLALQAELKRSFDPHGIFNPGRLYAGL